MQKNLSPLKSRLPLRPFLYVTLVAALAFLPFVVSPPHLMDDVDAVQAQIARNMLESGDFVTARLDGVVYLEKSPLIYWIMAGSFRIFGVHDWAARLPLALINIALCLVTTGFTQWAFGRRAAVYSGTILATCIGIFLFTRILIPDAALTLTLTLILWSFLRLIDPEEPHPNRWYLTLYISVAAGLLLKGLIAAVFPIAIVILFIVLDRRIAFLEAARRMRLLSGLTIVLVLAAPWHILATLRNPPLFDFTMHSGPGSWHGFFWFYFFNEHLFRFLNLRYPRDYNTVPRIWFWLLHFVWLFPWSLTLLSALRRSTGHLKDLSGHDAGQSAPAERQSCTRVLALIWIGFIMIFFSLSTTQEYYSLPIYPALTLILGSDLGSRTLYPRMSRYLLQFILLISLGAVLFLLIYNLHVPTPGDISAALTQNPDLYTLSLGHMGDLTLRSFAYLRIPLLLAGIALLIGVVGLFRFRRTTCVVAVLAVMMLLFLQAARLALVAFDPYLSSKNLADALDRQPSGELIEGDAYYAFSSVFFYTNRTALLWKGRSNNLEYGSNSPHAPQVFIEDQELQHLWNRPIRTYLLVYGTELPYLKTLLAPNLHVITTSGGNYLLCNQR
jgi:4-amino-4-deoxy-L-arabinose transferase-like glycosyltransferase